jgi:hypothetical protein
VGLMLPPEDMDIEAYWTTFRDTLPNAESSIEAQYRFLETLTQHLITFQGTDEEHYPQLITSRRRDPSVWILTLKIWDRHLSSWEELQAEAQVYSQAIGKLFQGVRKRFIAESKFREGEITDTEKRLLTMKKSKFTFDRILMSLGDFHPEQPNLPFPKGKERSHE